MDGYKIPILVLISILAITTSTGIGVEINLDSLAKQGVKDINYPENFSDTFHLNASVNNPGSVACQYQLRADTNQTDDKVINSYSNKETIYPGQTARLKLYQIPLNYSGKIQGDLTVEYCGKKEKVENFTTESLNQTELQIQNKTHEPREKTVNKTITTIETGKKIENTILIPYDTPGYWKVQPAKVENKSAVLKYEAPVFEKWRNITYIAVNQETQEPIAKVKTDLNENPTLKEKITRNKYQTLLAISIILNLATITYIHRRKARSKVLNTLNKLNTYR